MIGFKELMDSVKVESYLDCVWFIEEGNRCKLLTAYKKNSNCDCVDREPDPLCVWVTKFLKSSVKSNFDDRNYFTTPIDTEYTLEEFFQQLINDALEKRVIR